MEIKIKVVLVDDQRLVRFGVASLLAGERDIEVIGEAASGEELLDQLGGQQPDVVLMDVSMPGMGGLEATRQVVRRHPNVAVIALTVHSRAPYPEQLLDAGARGYLSKDCDVATMAAAIRVVHGGGQFVASEIAGELMQRKSDPSVTSPFQTLSRRELEVVLMICSGMNGQQMADQTCLSPKTVSTYRHRVYEKLNIDNDVALAKLALRYGIIEE